jgi:hypothetical protein
MEDLTISRIIFGPSIRAIYRKTHQAQYNYIKSRVKKNIDKGYDVFAYISRVNDPKFIRPFRTGILRIAQELNIPVTPVVIGRIKHCLYAIQKQSYKVFSVKSFYVKNPVLDAIKLRRFFSSCF